MGPAVSPFAQHSAVDVTTDPSSPTAATIVVPPVALVDGCESLEMKTAVPVRTRTSIGPGPRLTHVDVSTSGVGTAMLRFR